METRDKTMAERADELDAGTWDAYWKLRDLSTELEGVYKRGCRIVCDETFDGVMPGGRSVDQYRENIGNAAEAIRLALRIIGDLAY